MSDDNQDTRTTAQALIDLLVDGWGVTHIFGLPGDGINPIMEAMRQRQDAVRFVQMRHEEAAAFAAVGYAKFSGRLGVCLSTTGPGAIHLLNGLYDARMDQVPVLAITGLQYSDLLGQAYQQDVDTDKLMMDVAVYNQRVMGPAQIDSVTNLAVRAALSRRGVAHITLPVDVQQEPMTGARYSENDQPGHTSAGYTPPIVLPAQPELQRAADVLNVGSRVAILIGSGARGAHAEVETVADLLGAPVAKALLGKDVLPDDAQYVTGGIGPIGTRATHQAMEGCDTFLLVGSSFPYVSYFPTTDGSVRGVQIDINPQRIGLRFPCEVELVGDARETLRALIPLIEWKQDRSFLEGIQQEIGQWRELMDEQETRTDLPLKPQVVARALSRALADDAILAGDSGTSALWTTRNIVMRGSQRFSVSGLMASMACGLPYAIGAQMAFPERQVVAFVGDGALSMLPGDLATLVRYNLPVKVVVIKNNALAFIRWEQMMYAGNPEYEVDLEDIDWTKVAEGFHVPAVRIEHPEQAEEEIERALHQAGPVLIEAVVDPYEPFLPASIKPTQANKMASALSQGEPNASRVAQEVYRYAVESVPSNRAVVEEALEREAPDLLSSAKLEHGERDAHRPASGDGGS